MADAPAATSSRRVAGGVVRVRRPRPPEDDARDRPACWTRSVTTPARRSRRCWPCPGRSTRSPRPAWRSALREALDAPSRSLARRRPDRRHVPRLQRAGGADPGARQPRRRADRRGELRAGGRRPCGHGRPLRGHRIGPAVRPAPHELDAGDSARPVRPRLDPSADSPRAGARLAAPDATRPHPYHRKETGSVSDLDSLRRPRRSTGCPPSRSGPRRAPSLIPTIRAVASDLAARADFDLDAISDLRMAVDEACATLVDVAAPTATLLCAFLVAPERHRGARRGRGGPAGRRASPPTRSAGGCCRRWPTRSRWSARPRRRRLRRRPSASGWTSAPATYCGEQGRPRVRPPRPPAGAVRRARRRTTRPRARCATSWSRGYLPVAQHIARRFANRGEPLDDLVQVATVGLINADRPVLPGPRARLLLLRGAHDQRRGAPALPRPRLVDAGAAAAQGPARLDQRRGVRAVAAASAGHRSPPRSPSGWACRCPRCWRGWRPPRPTAARRWTRCSSSEQGSATVGELVGAGRRRAGPGRLPAGPAPGAGRAGRARAHDRAAALLRQHDPDPDRRRGRHLADARLPAARADPGPAAHRLDPETRVG